MNIYKDYLNNIELAMSTGDKTKTFSESFQPFTGDIQKGFSPINLSDRLKEDSLLPSMKEFASDMGLKANFNQKLGLHPDFAHLKGTKKVENHYIISAFIDIKGSTNLFKRYTPETVLVINETIQKAAIHTCIIYGGYVHRLQGDGLFVYFGGKNVNKSEAVKQALLSSGIFSYFVKNDLKRVFDQKGIDRIYTRIGIDLGHDDDVIWSDAGIGEISEVTTCSLHTNLAPKMQSNAVSNGIVIGEHVKKEFGSNSELITPVCHRTREDNDRYIFEIPDENFRYTQYDFDWLKFLKSQEFIATDLEERLTYKKPVSRKVKDPLNILPIAAKNTPYLIV